MSNLIAVNMHEAFHSLFQVIFTNFLIKRLLRNIFEQLAFTSKLHGNTSLASNVFCLVGKLTYSYISYNEIMTEIL